MAINNPGKELNKAIVNKVDKILSNTDCPRTVDIHIQATVGGAPFIEYKITELIGNSEYEDKN